METKTPQYFIDALLPLALPKAYTYCITSKEKEFLGQGFRVAVPFGKQKIYTAIVSRIHQVAPQTYEPKSIVMIMDEAPVVTSTQLNFWKWMSSYYMCTQGEIFRASLPAALMIESQSVLVKKEASKDQLNTLSDTQYLVYEALQKQSLTLDEISQITDLKRVMPLVLDMIDKNAAMIHQRLEEKFKPKKLRMIQLETSFQESKALESLLDNIARAPKQIDVLMTMLGQKKGLQEWIEVSKIKQQAQVNSSVIKTLIDKGVLKESYQEANRILIKHAQSEFKDKKLSDAQGRVLEDIKIELIKKEVVLFEGVTASGKTEVYIHLITEQIKAGKQVLYLLPEISLTSQIVSRLAARFGKQVLVYHSRYSIHERTEIWKQVLDGGSQGQIIVGARSAILLPFQNLGLVIVDEEHENSYKQFDPAPRYHARDSAIYLAKNVNARVVLGSATPSIETAENVRNGKYGWVKLTERYGGVSLPNIELVNLKEAYRKKKMSGMFSESLLDAIRTTLGEGKQVILFQNRRGYAPILECVSCGHAPQCTQCDVSLTYHQTQNQLRCHYCGYNIPMPTQCHACGMPTLTTKGVGTQQIQEQVQQLFPEVTVGRMDWDSTRGKWDFDKIIEAFDNGQIQILVGTQMVVKGLDFKNVLLVGVINADHVLNLPDFRAHERSYQMLCQVAGRAGRSDRKGIVLIQTFQPEHPTLKQVIDHDYSSLFQIQKREREQYRYPPYFRMIRITFKSRQYETVNMASDWFTNVIKQSYKGSVLGPVVSYHCTSSKFVSQATFGKDRS
jgi:primosomal protein N' (replication factor Y)